MEYNYGKYSICILAFWHETISFISLPITNLSCNSSYSFDGAYNQTLTCFTAIEESSQNFLAETTCEEILQHLHFCKEKCAVFQGRTNVLEVSSE